MKRIFFILFYISLFSTIGVSQSITTSNIHFTKIDDKIVIFYDLPANNDSLNVKVFFYKTSDNNFFYSPIYISGDVGIGTFSGANRKIIWYFKKEPAYLFTGSGHYFNVIATIIPKKIIAAVVKSNVIKENVTDTNLHKDTSIVAKTETLVKHDSSNVNSKVNAQVTPDKENKTTNNAVIKAPVKKDTLNNKTVAVKKETNSQSQNNNHKPTFWQRVTSVFKSGKNEKKDSSNVKSKDSQKVSPQNDEKSKGNNTEIKGQTKQDSSNNNSTENKDSKSQDNKHKCKFWEWLTSIFKPKNKDTSSP